MCVVMVMAGACSMARGTGRALPAVAIGACARGATLAARCDDGNRRREREHLIRSAQKRVWRKKRRTFAAAGVAGGLGGGGGLFALGAGAVGSASAVAAAGAPVVGSFPQRFKKGQFIFMFEGEHRDPPCVEAMFGVKC